jgi:small-conductance mechanosensitive channel/CRP-like cAMP-binding protein
MTTFDSGIALALGVLLLNFLAWRFFRFEQTAARLLVRVGLFAILSATLWQLGTSPFRPAPWAGDPPRHILFQILGLLWWIQAAQVVAVGLNVIVLPSSLRRERLLQDVFRAAVFLAAIVLGVAYVLEMPIGGLIATSGALAIIVGLAVQSTLSDVFSGIVLNATQPFRIGDLVTIGDIQGKVVDSDWRATTLLNGQGNFVVVPNSTAAKLAIINESRPALVHGITVSIQVASHVRPGTVLAALHDAIEGTKELLSTPAPVASVKAVRRRVVDYELSAYVASADLKSKARNEIADQVYRHLMAHGVAMGEREGASVPVQGQRLLRSVDMFQTLTDEQLTPLCKQLAYEFFEPGDVIYQVGVNCPDERRCLYIVASGVVASLIEHDKREVEVHRLIPGDAAGRSGILTGVSSAIKLKAIGKVQMVRLSKEALTPVLQEHPEIAKDMLDTLMEYEARVRNAEKELPSAIADQKNLFQRLLDGMRRMHGLLH